MKSFDKASIVDHSIYYKDIYVKNNPKTAGNNR